jgi:hypothetical protein
MGLNTNASVPREFLDKPGRAPDVRVAALIHGVGINIATLGRVHGEPRRTPRNGTSLTQ